VIFFYSYLIYIKKRGISLISDKLTISQILITDIKEISLTIMTSWSSFYLKLVIVLVLMRDSLPNPSDWIYPFGGTTSTVKESEQIWCSYMINICKSVLIKHLNATLVRRIVKLYWSVINCSAGLSVAIINNSLNLSHISSVCLMSYYRFRIIVYQARKNFKNWSVMLEIARLQSNRSNYRSPSIDRWWIEKDVLFETAKQRIRLFFLSKTLNSALTWLYIIANIYFSNDLNV